MRRKVGVSMASLLPRSLGDRGLITSDRLADEAGFDGIQVLPFRGIKREALQALIDSPWEDNIISYERAWNFGTFLGATLRCLHLAGEEQPLFRDWLLFGSCRAAMERFNLIAEEAPCAIFVSHEKAGGCLEMHPELLTGANIYADHPGGVVWDTEHVIRNGRHGELPIMRDWRMLLEAVKDNISLIHVKDGADGKMLQALASATPDSVPVIFEGRPPWSNFLGLGATIRWLKEKRKWLAGFFG